MSASATRVLTPEAQRALAVQLFNRTWELLESPRSPADDRTMLASAIASRLHWADIGTAENYAAGDWLVAHVASHLGYSDVALEFAAASYQTAISADPPVDRWVIASAQEGLARAHACAGHDAERDRYAAEARRTLETVDDTEDRDLIAGQLATIPGLAEG
jgi:exoribonuclease II